MKGDCHILSTDATPRGVIFRTKEPRGPAVGPIFLRSDAVASANGLRGQP